MEETSSKIRRVTYTNAPVNVVGAYTDVQLIEIPSVDALSQDDEVHVVVFDSGTPEYFYNDADLGQVPDLLALTGNDGTPMWVDLVTRSPLPVVSIASSGRTRGGGDEIALAFGLRYARRKQAVFSQPEVAGGIVPGGGASDRSARLLGRDRALEAVLTGDDYDATQAKPSGGSPERSLTHSSMTSCPFCNAQRLQRRVRSSRCQGTHQPLDLAVGCRPPGIVGRVGRLG